MRYLEYRSKKQTFQNEQEERWISYDDNNDCELRKWKFHLMVNLYEREGRKAVWFNSFVNFSPGNMHDDGNYNKVLAWVKF